ncbi:MAG: DUF4838 domain-containing protein, partial [Kiritimatiellae bacterium]|nr:DUF4838 domain-containing protein [Kiritimatiellia bacterium]
MTRPVWTACLGMLASMTVAALGKGTAPEYFPLTDGSREAVVVGDASAGDLIGYIERSTGRKLRLIAEKDYDPGAMPYAVFTGDSAKARDLFGERLAEMGIDDYIVHVATNLVVLAGATAETRQWAQYDFLREYLGVDSYFPHRLGLVIPKHDKVLVPTGTRFERPVFKNRALWSFNAEGKGELGWSQGVIPWRTPLQQRGPVASHTIQDMIAVKEFGQSHPEYFPTIDGKRKITDSGSGPGPCTSNPEVIKIVAEKVKAYFDAHPKERYFSLGMTDGGFCQCNACKALDGPVLKIPGCARGEPVCRRWFVFLNQVAAEVRKSHPDKIITTLAYAGCEVPPDNLALEPNILPFICWTHTCWFDQEVKRVNLDVTDAWLSRLNQIGIYEYAYGASLAIPMIYSRDMADYLQHVTRNAKDKDALGMFTECGASWGLDGPKLWILEKLMWNPEQDVESLTARWCDALFAGASPAMQRYFKELEQLRHKNGPLLKGINDFVIWKHKVEPFDVQDIFGVWPKEGQLRLFPPDDVARCQAILKEADEQAGTEVVKDRIAYFASTFRLTEYASKTYHAYAKLNESLWTNADPRQLMTELIEGDVKAPETDAHEYALRLREQDHTRFRGPSIILSGSGLAVREIVKKTAWEAVAKALAEGKRDRETLVAAAESALLENAPPQDLTVTPVGQKRMEILRSMTGRLAFAPRVVAPPTIDGKPGESLWQWNDQQPW